MLKRDGLSTFPRQLSALAMVIALSGGIAVTGSIAHADTTKNPYGAAPAIDPAAPNETILTMQNGKKQVKYSYNSLLKMKLYTISIFEPFVKKRQSFTCVSVQKLFDAAGIKSSQKVSTIALNDYVYNNIAGGFTASSGCLAVMRNGLPIPYDQGGPIRLIYPDKTAWATVLNAWNWSLSAIKTLN